jgi:hypothetical protein
MRIIDAKGEVVMHAGPYENFQIKIKIKDDYLIQRGYILCQREINARNSYF